jgi:opacity protein-like surface antigen
LPALLSALWWPAAFAHQLQFSDLHVVKKPGKQTGPALVAVNGKIKRLAQHAVEAWPVMDRQNALVLVLEAKGKEISEYYLRFYDGATRKRHDLGMVPFSSAELLERKQNDGSWVFVLSGTVNSQSELIIADANGIRGRLEGASAPQLGSDTLKFRSDPSGGMKSMPVRALLGQDMTAIYESSTSSGKTQYVQFLSDGTSVVAESDGPVHIGTWLTNGEEMIVTGSDGSQRKWPRTSLTPVTGVPAGTRLAVRLLQSLASDNVKEGDPVQGVLISPATINNTILIPQGSQLSGTITTVHGVGWAVRHETAAVTLEFTAVTLPGGEALPIHTQLYQVENSRESVNRKGAIQGIRSTGTPGHSAESKVASVAALDPVAYLFTTTAATAALGFAEPEILYPAGTEVLIEFTAPLITSKTYPRMVPEFPGSDAEQAKLISMVRDLPFLTSTKGSHKPSDLTNLVFIGPPEGLRRAFHAAGWLRTDTLTANSTFMAIKTFGGNQIYNQAPMSTLLLDERPPVFTLTKTTNTVNSRHHLRVFDPLMKYEGETVLTSSSTQDIGVAFSPKQKTFIHVIDEYIDNERSKVVNDLEFTGCVEAMDLVPRPWVPQNAYNSTGDKLRTDGAVAVMRISDCQHPRETPDTPAEPPRRLKRITRDTILTLRNDVYRGNLVYQGVTGGLWVHKYLATKDELKPDSGTWRKTDQSGTQFKGVGNLPRDRQSSEKITSGERASEEAQEQAAEALEEAHRWDPPRYEIGLRGGYLNYPSTRVELVSILAYPKDFTNPNLVPYITGLSNQFNGGWTAGISLTLNTWKRFSNEFTYSHQRGQYQYTSIFTKPTDTLVEGTSGLVTRQFDYNLLWNLRPPQSRWRFYIAGGPALILVSLASAPLKQPAGPFKLGLQNVGLLLAAFDTGSTPPLDGGGVFSVGVQYGGGIKYRVHPRITLRADFRETWSKNPQFITGSYTKEYLVEQGYDSIITRLGLDQAYQQQRFTLGVAFTF